MKLRHTFREIPGTFTLISMNVAPQPAAPVPPPFVDLETAARLAGVTRRTVQNKLSSREISPKAVKMAGRQKLVSVAALEAVFGTLHPLADASPSGDEVHGNVHGNFHEAAEVVELRAKVAAKDDIIANLQSTLDHERKDREHERENWRKTLERTQANLLAAQDTPTARAIAGASSKGVANDVTTESIPTVHSSPTAKPKNRRAKKSARPWWRLFAA